MATQSRKGRGKSRNTGGGQRRQNWDEENPSGLSTTMIALGAGVAAAAVVTVIMVNRKNMAINACKMIGGLGQIGGDTGEPVSFVRRRAMNPQPQGYAQPAAGYGQPRYPYGGA